jgi:hypothetical protein
MVITNCDVNSAGGACTHLRSAALSPVWSRSIRSYRFVPAGTAWYRLGPDKFFSPHAGGACTQYCGRGNVSFAPTNVGGYLLSRSLSGRRWDYAGAYAGLSGTKMGRFPLNPGYSRVIPHNNSANFFAGQQCGLSKERSKTRHLVSYQLEGRNLAGSTRSASARLPPPQKLRRGKPVRHDKTQ